MAKETVVLRRSIIVKSLEKDFGLGSGVIVQDEAAYTYDPEKQSRAMLGAKMLADKEEFLKNHIEVRLEQISDK